MRQLLAKGNYVHATAREPSRADRLDKLKTDKLSVSYVDTAASSSIKVTQGAPAHTCWRDSVALQVQQQGSQSPLNASSG